MTVIIVTFVCDFTKKIGDGKKEKGKKGKGNKGKEKKGKEKNKKGKKGKEVQIKEEKKKEITEEIKDEDLAVVVNVKKPIKYLHIEYNLLPGKLIYKIDVVFWGTIAKVYTNDGMRAMKSINKDGHYWIAFSVKHKVLLDINDLIKLKSHAANFSITTSKNKIGSSVAKKDADKTFYFEEEAIELKYKFAEAFETDPNVDKIDESEIDLKTRNINDIKYILDDILNFPTQSEPQSAFYVIPDDLHQKRTLNIIEKVATNMKINCLNSLDDPLDVNELLAVKKKGKGKKGKKEKSKKSKKDKKKGKQKKNDTSQIVLSGESYFTYPSMSLFDLKLQNDDLSNSFACIDVQHLMNADQKHELSPMIIKVHKIVNIPSDILLKHGFSLIYVSYNICNINCKSGARPINTNIHFNDFHIYFMERSNLAQFAEYIQSKYLIIQMHGVRIIPPEKPSEMFGQNIRDDFISSPIQNQQYEVLQYNEGDKEINQKSVLLAIARIKLNELLKPFWRVTKTQQCMHPRYIRYLDEDYDKVNRITVNTINIECSNIFDQNPLTENILLSSGLSIKFGIRLVNPIVNVLDGMIEADDSMNRILLIIFQPTIAKSFMFNIYVHNSHWLMRKNIVPNILGKVEEVPAENYVKNAITGFTVGCGEYCIMFLEGTRKWTYQLFWSVIRTEKKQLIKIIYNSNYVYEKRIYSGLIILGGVYFISLQHSLNDLLHSYKTYIKGYMPEPCRRALHKLDLIRQSNLIDEFPENLLPTVKELISLNIEWGVPLHWPL